MLKVINEGQVVAKVNIDGKIYDVRTGKLVESVVKPTATRKPTAIKNNHRKVKTSNAASRATYTKPVVVAKQSRKNIDGIIPAAAIKPNPISAKKSKKKTLKEQKSQRKKLMQGIAIVIVVVIGFGLLAFFYFPSLSVNFAASQAGITGARHPSYIVDGYFVDGAIQTEQRRITINYRNRAGDIYSISQQSSTWDSKGLLENHIIIEGLSYQVLMQRGLTIYRLEDGATWVSGGILYTISNGRQLDNDQVLRIIEGI